MIAINVDIASVILTTDMNYFPYVFPYIRPVFWLVSRLIVSLQCQVFIYIYGSWSRITEQMVSSANVSSWPKSYCVRNNRRINIYHMGILFLLAWSFFMGYGLCRYKSESLKKPYLMERNVKTASITRSFSKLEI